VRITTWNVNSIHANFTKKLAWLKAHDADVVLLQETKHSEVGERAFPVDAFGDLGYDVAHRGNGGRNGVAILSKDLLLNVVGADLERRFLTVQTFEHNFICAYAPAQPAARLPWLRGLAECVKEHQPDFLVGDLNLTMSPLDAQVLPTDQTTEEERELIRSFGLVDIWRHHWPDAPGYTWLRPPTAYRLDYLFVHPKHMERVFDVKIDNPQLSDHCPVTLRILL